ncbi:hypothetical protein OKN5_20660 [Bacillus altitudinis]
MYSIHDRTYVCKGVSCFYSSYIYFKIKLKRANENGGVCVGKQRRQNREAANGIKGRASYA